MSVGIDLLEIERMEQALERRPGLALRLFTDGERAYAARARAAGPASRGALLREGGRGEGAAPGGLEPARHRGRGGGGRDARSRCTAGSPSSACEVDVSLTHSKVTAGAVALVR